jgi:hypothetical protein
MQFVGLPPSRSDLPGMVADRGIEPRWLVAPFWRGVRDSNPSLAAVTRQRGPKPSHAPSEWSERLDSNQYRAGFEAAASCRWATLGWSPRRDSNSHILRSERSDSCRLVYRGMVPLDGLEPSPQRLRAARAALTLQRRWWAARESNPIARWGEAGYSRPADLRPVLPIGASGRTRTGRHRVGSPRSCRWTTLALVRPTGNDPVPPRWQRGVHPPHPGRTWTGGAHRPIDYRRLSKTPPMRAIATAIGDSARI